MDSRGVEDIRDRLFGHNKSSWKNGSLPDVDPLVDYYDTREGIDFFARMVDEDILKKFKAPSIRESITSRSSANHQSNIVSMSSYDSDTKLVIHELAHLMEGDKEILQDTIDFLIKRAGPKPKLEKLRKITGRKVYGDSELAFPHAGFAQPYSAKPYIHKPGEIRYPSAVYVPEVDGYVYATEVLSTGMEKMYDDPLGFMSQDPEFFDFIWDTLIKKASEL